MEWGPAATFIGALILVANSRIRGTPRWVLWLWRRVCVSYSWCRSAPWRLYLFFCRRGIADARAADLTCILEMIDTMLNDAGRTAVSQATSSSLADDIPDTYPVQDMGLRFAVLITSGFVAALQELRRGVQDSSEFQGQSSWSPGAPVEWILHQDQEDGDTYTYMQRSASSFDCRLRTPPILRNGRWHWAAPVVNEVVAEDIGLTPEVATVLVGLRDGPTHVEMMPIFDERARELERLGYVTRTSSGGDISSIIKRTDKGRRLAAKLRGVPVD